MSRLGGDATVASSWRLEAKELVSVVSVGPDPQQNDVDIVSEVEVDCEVEVDKEVVVETERAVETASEVTGSISETWTVSVSVEVVNEAMMKSFVVVTVVTQLVFAVTVSTTVVTERGDLE